MQSCFFVHNVLRKVHLIVRDEAKKSFQGIIDVVTLGFD